MNREYESFTAEEIEAVLSGESTLPRIKQTMCRVGMIIRYGNIGSILPIPKRLCVQMGERGNVTYDADGLRYGHSTRAYERGCERLKADTEEGKVE